MKLHLKYVFYSKVLITSIATAYIFSSCSYNKDGSIETELYEESTDHLENTSDSLSTPSPQPQKPVNIGESLPITRGLAAKMLALTFSSKEEIDTTKRTITFSDTSPEKWYDKYINYAYSKKYIQGIDNKFMPDEYLTVIQAQYIIDKIDSAHKIKINITEETKDKPISYNLWTEIYIKTLTNLADKISIKEKFNIIARKATILALPQNNNLIKEGYVITDIGFFKCSGIDLSPFIDNEISFWTKENEIIALSDITNENPTIKNVYITENDEVCTIFSGGAEKTYEKSENLTQTENNENNNLKIADITLTDKKISKIAYALDVKEKQIKSFNSSKLICVDNETFDISPDFKVYYIQNNKVMLGNRADIIEGKTYEIYLRDNKIQAFIFTKL